MFLRRSKCDVSNQGTLLRVPASPDADTSAVVAVNKYIRESVVRLEAGGPLFVLVNGKPLTRSKVVSALKETAEKAGLGAAGFSGISFRRGGALSMALAGVEDRVIQALGRWSSDCYRRYIQLTDVEVARATSMAASSSGDARVEWAQPFPKEAFD